MLKSIDIREIKFSKATMGGYKQDEVDIFLDKVEADYEQYERLTHELQEKIDRLNTTLAENQASQSNLQNILIHAQRTADSIIAEAKEKSEKILADAKLKLEELSAKEKELRADFAEGAEKRKQELSKELDAALRAAKLKTGGMEAAANDAVARQQVLFDRLKLEISAFKADVTRKYKEHLEILQKLPDSVPMDPKQISAAVSDLIDRMPDPADFVPQPEPEAPAAPPAPAEPEIPVADEAVGFFVQDDFEDKPEE